MEDDLLAMYRRASEWTATKVPKAAARLGAETTCDDWDVGTLMSHMLDTQRYFAGVARGEDVSPPAPIPPGLLTGDPAGDFQRARADVEAAFAEPGVVEQTFPSLGIAFSDQLLHGWDLAASTAQDTTMPGGLPEAAFEMIHGRFTEEQRKGIFKPEIAVPAGATAQDRLLAYTGRDPSFVMVSR